MCGTIFWIFTVWEFLAIILKVPIIAVISYCYCFDDSHCANFYLKIFISIQILAGFARYIFVGWCRLHQWGYTDIIIDIQCFIYCLFRCAWLPVWMVKFKWLKTWSFSITVSGLCFQQFFFMGQVQKFQFTTWIYCAAVSFLLVLLVSLEFCIHNGLPTCSLR